MGYNLLFFDVFKWIKVFNVLNNICEKKLDFFYRLQKIRFKNCCLRIFCDFIYWMNFSLEVKYIYDYEFCIKIENNVIIKLIINDKLK